MFRFFSLEIDPQGVAGTIVVSSDPRKTGKIFGLLEDVDGNTWNLNGQVNKWVLAQPYKVSSTYLGGTDTMPDLFTTFRCYEIKIKD